MKSLTVVLLLVVLLLAMGTGAAVPDLSTKDLFVYGDHIFIGRVNAIVHKDVPNEHHPEDWVNRHWKMDVTVVEVYKTAVNPHHSPPVGHDNETMWEGQDIHVMMWKAWKRPKGVVGPQGVGTLPKVGATMSFFTRYLHRDPNQRSMYHLSFPHEEEESELAAQDGPEVGPTGTRRTTHTKAYNALTPNGIDLPAVLLQTKVAAEEL
jgi:hypothetical protein